VIDLTTPFRTRVLVTVASAVLFVDQLTKTLTMMYLPVNVENPYGPVFSLTHVRNTGAAFGIFTDSNRGFIGLTTLILVVLAFLGRKLAAEGRLTALGISLLWGGALGNLIDRLRFGSVTDLLDFHWGRHHWPAFNVADSAICVGVAMLFLDSLRRGRR
jgi:signal peptidase II